MRTYFAIKLRRWQCYLIGAALVGLLSGCVGGSGSVSDSAVATIGKPRGSNPSPTQVRDRGAEFDLTQSDLESASPSEIFAEPQDAEQPLDIRVEIARLRSAIERLQFGVEFTTNRQQVLFQDIDRRLSALELGSRGSDGSGVDYSTPRVSVGGRTSPAPEETTDPSIDAASTRNVPVVQKTAYDRAFSLLKANRHAEAIRAFENLVSTWPKSALADDAYYWMSEARYLRRQFRDAMNGFNAVVRYYPDSPRVPESMLKIGYTQYDLGAYKDAAETFRILLQRFPSHQVAAAAKRRLQRIEKTIRP